MQLKKYDSYRETTMTREKRQKKLCGDASIKRHDAVTGRKRNMRRAQLWLAFSRSSGEGEMQRFGRGADEFLTTS